MVSIKGRSHTSANLDLEINEESKNKEIVRITLPLLDTRYNWIFSVWQSGTQEDDSISSRQESEQPSKKKNVSDSPNVAKKKNIMSVDTHIV